MIAGEPDDEGDHVAPSETTTERAVGVMLPRDLPAGDVLDFARRADAHGFDELWVVEDLGFRGGTAQAAAVLAATERIRVGVGVLPAAARNPAFTAMEVATLGQLFPGRVDVGLGHGMPGWMRSAGAWPSSPLTLLEEHLRAVRALVRGDVVELDGTARYVALDGVRLEPAVVPTTTPRVLAGVRGPRSATSPPRARTGSSPTTSRRSTTTRRVRGTRHVPGWSGSGSPTGTRTSRRCRSPRSSGRCAAERVRGQSSSGACRTSGSTTSRWPGRPRRCRAVSRPGGTPGRPAWS